jgi:hypothetical protein
LAPAARGGGGPYTRSVRSPACDTKNSPAGSHATPCT